MADDPALRELVVSEILRLVGDDPFAHVLEAGELHRHAHGSECGLYPAGPAVMNLVAAFVRASGATRILELGAGMGYSTIWLAQSAEPTALIYAVDRFEEHVQHARTFAAELGFAKRISFIAG